MQENQSSTTDLYNALEMFYKNQIVTTIDGSIQVFHSFTYGEMVISTLLLLLVLITTFKWFWEVLR